MKKYVDNDKLQEFTTKLITKLKTIFSSKSELGDIFSLTTTNKTSTVAAINELDSGLDTLNSKFAGPTWHTNLTTSTIAYTKYAGIVTVTHYANMQKDIASGTWVTLGTLPSGYRPSRRIDIACTVGYDANLAGVVRISTSGNIDLWTKTALTTSTSYLSFSVSFPV